MGMPLPDLPQKDKKSFGWQMAYAHLRDHGPSTLDQILPNANRQTLKNLATVLRTNDDLFVRDGVVRPGRGGGKGVWKLKEGVK